MFSVDDLMKLNAVTPQTVKKPYRIEPHHDKMCLRESPTRADTNWPAQLQRLARVLKFRL